MERRLLLTDVERAGGLGIFKLEVQQVAGLGVVSEPYGHAQDDPSSKLQDGIISHC